ncbi:MAG: glycosyl transferase family 2 [Chthoniobacter sp.]|nr:glycosyl transferase family 2 [Chthoniobacter sp.]
MNAPRVTVLMCVHNAARWLPLTMRSVLDQTFTDFEFLILDDASSDESVGIIQSFADPRNRLIRSEENVGLTRLLNRGLHSARGELVARQDADDLSAPTRLAEQVAFLDAHPEVPLVGTEARLIDAAGRSRGSRELPREAASIRWMSLLDNPIIHTSAMFRAAVVHDEFRGYDESFSSCQDYDLWARVMEKYPVANLPRRLVSVREHGASVSATRRSEARELIPGVVRRIVENCMPGLQLTDEEVALLCAYRRHLAAEEVARFHTLLARLDAAFARHFAGALTSDDLRRTRAHVFARIGYNLLTADRRLAWGELQRALKTWPALGLRLPWLRIAVLSALGAHARRWMDRMQAAA